ncbi:unnamed protein product, partial [Staurois parvus]
MLSLVRYVGAVLRPDSTAKVPLSPREPAYHGCPYKPHVAECHELSELSVFHSSIKLCVFP